MTNDDSRRYRRSTMVRVHPRIAAILASKARCVCSEPRNISPLVTKNRSLGMQVFFSNFPIRGRFSDIRTRYMPCVGSAVRKSDLEQKQTLKREAGTFTARRNLKNGSIKGDIMNSGKAFIILMFAIILISGTWGCSTPLSTREKGAGVGALGGAAAGGLIGAAVGHPGIGAAIGGTLGLGAGALIGDQLQGQEQTQYRQQQQIEQNQAEIQSQRQQIDQLRRRQEY